MVHHLRRMKDADKAAFVRFVSKYRSSKSLVHMFRAFENADPSTPFKGLLNSIQSNPNGKAYKTFHRFRKKVFEFELSSKRLEYFRKIDPHHYYYIYLKKEILAAEMLTERNAYHISIQLLKETLKRAQQYEYLDLQRQCLKDLVEFSRYTGHPRLESKYSKEFNEISNSLAEYEGLCGVFEKAAFGLRCCAHHVQQLKSGDADAFFNYDRTWPMKKAVWMGEFLVARTAFHRMKYRQSLFHANALKRELNLRPGLYPATFRLSIHLLILENLWYLKKFKLIGRYSRKLLRLDHFPVYQRIPVQQYFLHYFLLQGNHEMINLLLEDFNLEHTYRHFPHFMARARVVECASFFQKCEYHSFLACLNRNFSERDLDCAHLNFTLRCLEVISLRKTGDDILALDKLECLRRFISRHDILKNDDFCQASFRILKNEGIRETIQMTTLHKAVLKTSVYDLHWITVQWILHNYGNKSDGIPAVPTSAYQLQEVNYSRAAEEKIRLDGQE